MKIARFSRNGSERYGVLLGDDLADVTDRPALAAGIPGFLAAGAGRLASVRGATGSAARVPLASVRLLAPIPRPPKFLAIGLNYADHVTEAHLEAPSFPVFFNKQTTCVVGPCDAGAPAARLDPARLRGRARHRDRPALPPRAARARRTR